MIESVCTAWTRYSYLTPLSTPFVVRTHPNTPPFVWRRPYYNFSKTQFHFKAFVLKSLRPLDFGRMYKIIIWCMHRQSNPKLSFVGFLFLSWNQILGFAHSSSVQIFLYSLLNFIYVCPLRHPPPGQPSSFLLLHYYITFLSTFP